MLINNVWHAYDTIRKTLSLDIADKAVKDTDLLPPGKHESAV